MKKEHKRKIIAPIIISAINAIYLAVYFAVIIALPMPIIAKILVGIIPAAGLGIFIFVLCERIKEINGGEEDDLSKY